MWKVWKATKWLLYSVEAFSITFVNLQSLKEQKALSAAQHVKGEQTYNDMKGVLEL